MPGGVGTDIAINSGRILGQKPPEDWTDEDVDQLRERWQKLGANRKALGIDERLLELSNAEIRVTMAQRGVDYRKIGITPAAAAKIIIDGVKKDHWRILVGKDAEAFDRAVRKDPLHTYDLDFDRYVRAEWQD